MKTQIIKTNPALKFFAMLCLSGFGLSVNASPPLAGYQFYESFDSLESIAANGGNYNGIALESGKFGNAVRFAGAASLVYRIPNINTQEGTMMFWVSPHYQPMDGLSHTYVYFRQQPIVAAGWDFTFSDGWWEPAGSKLTYFVFQPLHARSSGPDFLFGNTWRFVTLTWKNPAGQLSQRQMTIYINGEKIQDEATSPPFPDKNTCDPLFVITCFPYDQQFSPPLDDLVYLGGPRAGVVNGGYADASMDEFVVYPRAMSTAEIDQAYKSYLGANWDYHRNREWMEPQISAPYVPKRNRQGRIVENRIMLDEGALFLGATDAQLDKLKRANINVYVPNIWHGSGTRFHSLVEPRYEGNYGQFYTSTDALRELIDKAHALGIEVHPWFTVALNQWGATDLHPAWKPAGTPSEAYNVFDPDFRRYIVDMMIDVVQRYDVDGINLDYIRTGGDCKTQQCIDEYAALTNGANLLEELKKTGESRSAIWHEFQAAPVRAIVQDFHQRAKLIKPNLVISVDAHVIGEFRVGPVLAQDVQGRNSVHWLQDRLVDYVFDMDYNNKLTLYNLDLARAYIPIPLTMGKLLGNFDRTSTGAVVPRNPTMVKEHVRYSQRKWGGVTGLYLLSRFSEEQIQALATDADAPFAEAAVTNWSFRDPTVSINAPTDQSRWPAGSVIHLDGAAFDYGDGDLSMTIEWSATNTSGVSRPLGLGATVDAILPPGTYDLTAQATDADGNRVRRSVRITILDSCTKTSGYKITGKTLGLNNSVISGVTVTLFGPSCGDRKTTNANGDYEFFKLPKANYSVIPSKLGCSGFIPSSRNYMPLSSNKTEQKFGGAVCK